MSSDPQFQAAIDKAISHGRRNLLGVAIVVTVLGGLFASFGHITADEDANPLVVVIMIVASWVFVIVGDPGMQALDKLRTAHIDQWLPSTSHGMVALLGDRLAFGSLRPFDLKEQRGRRVTSIIFEEETKELTIGLVQGEGRDIVMVTSKLDPAVATERAEAFVERVRQAIPS